ncbi:HAMP domain-containing sensor histidine kinase [uncultured Aquimarina sp.]|uniref:ATP-binding protein n=1 Tax=uncultured Aquimarina sp. TaxID=575652 RepID=UPI00261B0C9F|nr:HAMP domain-containing sensor histidine kinase [uncultured Aquimarina sp.]
MLKASFIPVFCFLLFFSNFYAQQKKDCEEIKKHIDELSSVDEKLSESLIYLQNSDVACKYHLWKKRAQLFQGKFLLDSIIFSLDEAAKVANKLNNPEFFLEVSVKKASFLVDKNKVEESLELLNLCREKLDEHPSSNEWIGYFNTKANISRNKAEYEKALRYGDSGIAMAKKVNKTKSLHQGYIDKAISHITLFQYNKGVEALQEAIAILDTIDDKSELTFAYFTKGVCYERLEEYEKAAETLKLAVESARKTNDSKSMARAYSRMSISLIELRDEKALAVIDSVISISERTSDFSTLAIGYSDKGNAALNIIEDYDKAEKAFLASNKILNTKDVTKRAKEITLLTNLSGLIITKEKKKEYKKMYPYIKEYDKQSKKWNSLINKLNVANFYRMYYEGIKDYKQALSYNKRFEEINDSITNKEVRVDVADLEKKYETQKKEIEILKLNEESQTQKIKTQEAETKQYIYSGIALFSTLLLLIGLWAYVKIRKQQKELNNTHEKLKKSHEEVASINSVKDRLFSVISHDMRNMLVPFQRGGKILKHHIDKGDYDKVTELSHKLQENSLSLSHLLDNLLNWSLEQMNGYSLKQETIIISEELEDIKKSFIPSAEEKQTTINILGESGMTTVFDKGAFHIIFRNLIGNALKYTEDGTISIKFFEKDDSFIYEISDTGIGMSEEQVDNLFKLQKSKTQGTRGEKGTGIGLNLVYRFVEMNQGTIGVSSEMRIGTKFELSFPKVITMNTSLSSEEKQVSA